jgi:hypothetical protein
MLHSVRIGTKKLRYALEIVRDAAGLPVTRLVQTVSAAQDGLGRFHDLHVLEQRARTLAAATRPDGMARRITTLAFAIERECRRLHAAFLGERAGLLEAAAAVRTTIAPRLARRRLRMLKAAPGSRLASSSAARLEASSSPSLSSSSSASSSSSSSSSTSTASNPASKLSSPARLRRTAV